MSFLPSVTKAEYREGFQIQLTFNDGTTGTVDFREWLKGPIFEPLRAVAYFRRFFLDGGTVSWPNGADIAPETLHAAALETRSNTTLQPTSRARRKSKAKGNPRAARG